MEEQNTITEEQDVKKNINRLKDILLWEWGLLWQLPELL